MDLYDINSLKKDIEQNNLYNLFDSTFKFFTGAVLYQYQVPEYEEMRPDLVCQSIYKTGDYVDFLCDLNNIILPLNIMANDIILYVSPDDIKYFRLDEANAKALRNTYINSSKLSKPDPNRQSFVENDYNLPPTFLEIPSSSVKVVDGKIVLGGNT